VGGPVPPAVHEPATVVRWLGKPGPAYPGRFHSQGASAPLGGGPGLGPFPDNGKKASPEGEYRNLRGVEPRRKGEGQKGPRGRGLPAGIPEAQPAAPGFKGGRGPAYRTSHGGHGLSVAARPGRTGSATAVPRPKWGAAPGGFPGTAPAKQGRSPTASCERSRGGGQRGPRALRPLGPNRGEKPPLGLPTGGPTPRPHRAGGLLFVRGFVKVRLCAGVALLQPSRPVA
jgi:hypothetical protein